MKITIETLEKQLQLLSERSSDAGLNAQELYLLTKSMCAVAHQLQSQSDDVRGYLASVQLSAKELADICVGQYERTRRLAETDRKKRECRDKNTEPS